MADPKSLVRRSGAKLPEAEKLLLLDRPKRSNFVSFPAVSESGYFDQQPCESGRPFPSSLRGSATDKYFVNETFRSQGATRYALSYLHIMTDSRVKLMLHQQWTTLNIPVSQTRFHKRIETIILIWWYNGLLRRFSFE